MTVRLKSLTSHLSAPTSDPSKYDASEELKREGDLDGLRVIAVRIFHDDDVYASWEVEWLGIGSLFGSFVRSTRVRVLLRFFRFVRPICCFAFLTNSNLGDLPPSILSVSIPVYPASPRYRDRVYPLPVRCLHSFGSHLDSRRGDTV